MLITYCFMCHIGLNTIQKYLVKEVCAYYILKQEPYLIIDVEHPSQAAFSFIEAEGFVVSTETSCELVQIKPLGINYREDYTKVHFCIGRCRRTFP